MCNPSRGCVTRVRTALATNREPLTGFNGCRPFSPGEIIDETDKVLAAHYGFTEEELDFIINYDIKYRMGEELGNDE